MRVPVLSGRRLTRLVVVVGGERNDFGEIIERAISGKISRIPA